MEKINLNDVTAYTDDHAIATVLAEHPEVRVLWERGDLIDGSLVINGIQPVMHVVFEAIAEKQIQQGDPPEAGETFERLVDMGFSRHAARAAIARQLVPHIFEVLKEKRPFDKEAYARRLKLLGLSRDINLGKVGRNQTCPCGSGKKFKKCCLPFAGDIAVYENDGVLILGANYYSPRNYLEKLPPDSLLIQLENRSHIAEYLKKHGDIEGALACLQENLSRAEEENAKEGSMEWLVENALQDLHFLYMDYPELGEQGIKITERLIGIARNDRGKATYRCDRADMLAAAGKLQEAEKEYRTMIEDARDVKITGFIRYRYARFLDQYGRSGEAESILEELLAHEEDLDEETFFAVDELLDYIRNKE
jgi:tetratricopeptide (TPR) repeat protein